MFLHHSMRLKHRPLSLDILRDKRYLISYFEATKKEVPHFHTSTHDGEDLSEVRLMAYKRAWCVGFLYPDTRIG